MQDQHFTVFADYKPYATHHFQVIPKKHIGFFSHLDLGLTTLILIYILPRQCEIIEAF